MGGYILPIEHYYIWFNLDQQAEDFLYCEVILTSQASGVGSHSPISWWCGVYINFLELCVHVQCCCVLIFLCGDQRLACLPL